MASPESIYLDYAASTPLRPPVRQAIEPYLQTHFGNPSSLHARGRAARAALDEARDRIAQVLQVRSGEIIFTSGGTEADNLALVGVSEAHPHGRLLVSSVEHRAVLDPARWLHVHRGVPVDLIPVDSRGTVQVDWVLDHVTDDTALVSVMYVNNEIGTVEPIQTLGRALRERGILFHVDAVQAAECFALADLPCDLLSLSAHKFGGPKGAGLLWIRHDVPIVPLLHGGGQERERRAGTENVAGVVGMAVALEIAADERESVASRLRQQRDDMLAQLRAELPDTLVYGPLGQSSAIPAAAAGAEAEVGGQGQGEAEGQGRAKGGEAKGEGEGSAPALAAPSAPNILCVGWPGVRGETLVVALDLAGVEVSSGAACSAGSLSPSHVLQALGLDPELAAGGIRFSFGWPTTSAEVKEAVRRVVRTVRRVRQRHTTDFEWR